MLIGLSGYARTGKDTAAEYLVDNFGFTRLSFADPMRKALLMLDPMVSCEGTLMPLTVAHEIHGWEELKSVAPEVRGLLQRLGTEVGRNMFGKNFWVDQAMKEARQYEKVVFTDVRFINEADTIINHGGKVIRIERPGFGPINNHISETNMDGYSFSEVISNSGTPEEFKQKLAASIFVTNKDEVVNV